MSAIKHLFAVMACLCAYALSGFSQERASSVSELLASMPEGKCVAADYSMTVETEGRVGINYAGRLWWQNGMFRVEGDGYSIFCDGVHIWTEDSVAGEIVREGAVPLDSLIPSSGAGESGMKVSRTPDGGKITRIFLKMKNGASVSIDVPSMDFIGLKDAGWFAFDEKSVPEGFVFTALD